MLMGKLQVRFNFHQRCVVLCLGVIVLRVRIGVAVICGSMEAALFFLRVCVPMCSGDMLMNRVWCMSEFRAGVFDASAT